MPVGKFNTLPNVRHRGAAGMNASGSLGPYANDGAPVTDDTLVGTAEVGTLLIDTTNGVLYICTATNGTSTITWTVVGTQA